MFPIPFLKGSETFNSNRCFFIKAANRRAIFLKLIINRCHQMKADTLQMNMYTTQTEQACVQRTNIIASLWPEKSSAAGLELATLRSTPQRLFYHAFFRLIQRPGKAAEWQEHLEAVSILHGRGSNPASQSYSHPNNTGPLLGLQHVATVLVLNSNSLCHPYI